MFSIDIIAVKRLNTCWSGSTPLVQYAAVCSSLPPNTRNTTKQKLAKYLCWPRFDTRFTVTLHLYVQQCQLCQSRSHEQTLLSPQDNMAVPWEAWLWSKKSSSFGININQNTDAVQTESRQDEEEGDELDSHKEASPEEIKSREVVLG